MPWYDQWGWASEVEIPDRYTDMPIPENIPEGSAANWTGHTWIITVYSPPPVVTPPPVDKRITKLAFRSRFTLQEKVIIEMAALDNPAAEMPARQNAAALRAYLDDVRTASFINLDRADTRGGVLQLEALGIIAAGRALEILDTPPTAEERYFTEG
jgi:hypothetical protein